MDLMDLCLKWLAFRNGKTRFFSLHGGGGFRTLQLVGQNATVAATTKMFSGHFYRGVMIKVKIYVQIREKRVSPVDFFPPKPFTAMRKYRDIAIWMQFFCVCYAVGDI